MKPTLNQALAQAGYPAGQVEVVVRRATMVGWGSSGSFLGGVPEHVRLGPPVVVSVADLRHPFRHRFSCTAGVYLAPECGHGSGAFVLVPASDDAASWLVEDATTA